jgi:hypothetical protein
MNVRVGESGPHGTALKLFSSSQHLKIFKSIRLIIRDIFGSFLRNKGGRILKFTTHIRVVSFLRIYGALFLRTIACYVISKQVYRYSWNNGV